MNFHSVVRSVTLPATAASPSPTVTTMAAAVLAASVAVPARPATLAVDTATCLVCAILER